MQNVARKHADIEWQKKNNQIISLLQIENKWWLSLIFAGLKQD